MADGAYTNLSALTRLKYQAKRFSFLPRQPVRSLLAGRKASRLRGRGLNFEEIRNYLPGDDIRSIDWKVTARMRKPHTRVYTEERDRPTLLVIDQRVGMFFGSRVTMKSVTAAEVAALAAWRSLDVGDRVGAIVFNDSDTVVVKPRRSSKTVMQILQAVVQQNTALSANGTTPADPGRLNTILGEACRISTHDTLVCIISDFHGNDETTRRLLNRLARHNDIIAAFVFDPLEAEFPNAGHLVAGDGTKQIEFNSADDKLRRGFAKAFEDRLEKARQFLLRRQIPVLPLRTDLPVVEQVAKLLGHPPQGRQP